MTKQIFANGVSKAIPLVGAAISGGITFSTFKPMSEKFRKYLASCELANTDYYRNMEEEPIADVEIIEL